MNIPQVKARGLLLWWGKFRFMYGHATFYVGLIQMILIALMAYNTTIRPWASEYLGWQITFWQYCIVLAITVTVGIVIEFMVSVPALIAVSNEQMYKHESPIRTDFIHVQQRQDELDKKLLLIMTRLGIDPAATSPATDNTDIQEP